MAFSGRPSGEQKIAFTDPEESRPLENGVLYTAIGSASYKVLLNVVLLLDERIRLLL